MYADNWRPDYIVGITRGGNIPATIILNMTVSREALKVSLRDDDSPMKAMHGWLKMHLVIPSDTDDNKKKIPIVDDINDTGATFNWIMQDWSCRLFVHDPDWELGMGQC